MQNKISLASGSQKTIINKKRIQAIAMLIRRQQVQKFYLNGSLSIIFCFVGESR